jgi:putative endonuclease
MERARLRQGEAGSCPAPAPRSDAARPRRIAAQAAQACGRAGEAVAERLYRAEGGRILARRWRCPEGEIDLAVDLGGEIILVEVKARRTLREAAEAVTPGQSRRILAAAARFLAEHAPQGRSRIDVVLLDRQGAARRIADALRAEA